MQSLVYRIGKYPAYRQLFSIPESTPYSMHSPFTQRGRQTVILCQIEQFLRYLTVQRPVAVAEEHIVIKHV